MRHACRYNDYITGGDVYFNTIGALLSVGWFGATKDQPRLALDDGCDA
jgi:hypothetical protein